MIRRIICWLIGHDPGIYQTGPILWVDCKRCEKALSKAYSVPAEHKIGYLGDTEDE